MSWFQAYDNSWHNLDVIKNIEVRKLPSWFEDDIHAIIADDKRISKDYSSRQEAERKLDEFIHKRHYVSDVFSNFFVKEEPVKMEEHSDKLDQCVEIAFDKDTE
jgi:hypothetical protein